MADSGNIDGNPPSSSSRASPSSPTRPRIGSTSSSFSQRVRRMSRTFEEAYIPEGFLAASGDFASSVLSKPEQRRLESPTTSVPSKATSNSKDQSPHKPAEPHNFAVGSHSGDIIEVVNLSDGPNRGSSPARDDDNGLVPTRTFTNGYHFPLKHTFGESFRLGAIAFWHYTLTPLGFFVVLYGLLVVAWGGMLFLLLVNAAPAMCYPTCNDINSPRRVWVEIDSQIVNALFTLTGFGLAPWRFRDLYYLLQYRLFRNEMGLRRLAGIHRSWFRLQGSQDLDPTYGPKSVGDAPTVYSSSSIPYPETSIPDAPPTGHRARPSKGWKLDFVIWANVSNTFLQCVLCGFMWGMNRYNRPSWAVGLFVALAAGAAGAGGLMMFFEGKKVKKMEGFALSSYDKRKLEVEKMRAT